MQSIKYIFFFLVQVITVSLFSQERTIEDFMDKCKGMEGYTTIEISSDMFKLLSDINNNDSNLKHLKKEISRIRAVYTEANRKEAGFKEELIPGISTEGYSKLLELSKGNDNVIFFTNSTENSISELIAIIYENGTNILIHTEGEFQINNIIPLSYLIDVKGFEYFDKLKIINK